MKRSVIAIAVVTVLVFVAACGGSEEESQIIATAVPTYTVTASDGSPAAAPSAAAEEEPTAGSESEKSAHVAAPTAEAADAESAIVASAVESEAAEATADEVAQEVAPDAGEDLAPADETGLDTTIDTTAETEQVDEIPAESAEANQPVISETPEPESAEAAVVEEDAGADVVATEEVADESATTEMPQDDSAGATDAEQDAGAEEGTTEEVDMYAGLPEAVAALMPNADPVHGEQLSLMNGCIGCHNLDPNLVMAGPTWHNVGSTAESRIEGMGAAQYIHSSIVHPNDYVVDGYAANIMVSTYGETLSEQDQADLVAYLLGLRE